MQSVFTTTVIRVTYFRFSIERNSQPSERHMPGIRRNTRIYSSQYSRSIGTKNTIGT